MPSRTQVKVPRTISSRVYVQGYTDLPEPRDKSTDGERLTEQLFRTKPGTEAAVSAAERLRNHVRAIPAG